MTPPWVRPFLEHLTESCNVSGSCRAVGISSGAAYALRDRDADFAAAWDQAIEDASDVLEAEARRRAVQGVQEPVVYQGQLTPVWERDARGDVVMEAYEVTTTGKDGEPITSTAQRPRQAVDANGQPVWLTITKHSDALLALLLKGRRKRVFADRTELTGGDGGPVQMDDAARTARIAQILAAAQKRKAAEDEFGDLA